MKFFNSHLSTAELADAIENRLAAGDEAQVRAHLATCTHCTSEFAALQKAIGLMRRDESKDAPGEAFNFAVNLFRTRKQFAPKQSAAQIILAKLKSDVSQLAPAFGERSAATSGERQMLFEAGEFDVDLRVRRQTESFSLSGQVLGDVLTGSITLQSEDFEKTEIVSEFGEFAFANVPAGNYSLKLQLSDVELVISEIILD